MIKIFGKFKSRPGQPTDAPESDETIIPIRLGQKPLPATIDAPEGQCFWVNNGPVLKNISELRNALEKMNRQQFEYHTKRNGNDFSRWLDHVFGERDLAQKIFRLKTKQSMIKALDQFLQ